MTSPSGTTVPKQGPGVLARELKPDEHSVVLLHPTTGEYYTLEAVGARVWQLCDGRRTIAEISSLVAAEYDQSAEVIQTDVIELLKELMDERLVVAAV